MQTQKITEKTKLKLLPGLPLLIRNATELQLGLDPGNAIRLPIEFRKVLNKFDGFASLKEVLNYALDSGFDHNSTKVTIENLISLNYLIPEMQLTKDLTLNQKSHLLQGQRATNDDPAATAKRLDSVITIYGAGRIGLTLALLLGSSGFSNIRIVDYELITSTDLIPWGASRIDIGQRRDQVALTLLGRVHKDQLKILQFRDDRFKSDLIVYAQDAIADFPFYPIQLTDEALSCETPYLIIGAGSHSTHVSSVLLPGESGCVRCLHLNQSDWDNAWPTLITQLMGQKLPDLLPNHLVLPSALLAFQHIANWVDGGKSEPNTWWQLEDSSQKVFFNYPHNECGCFAINSTA